MLPSFLDCKLETFINNSNNWHDFIEHRRGRICQIMYFSKGQNDLLNRIFSFSNDIGT